MLKTLQENVIGSERQTWASVEMVKGKDEDERLKDFQA